MAIKKTTPKKAVAKKAAVSKLLKKQSSKPAPKKAVKKVAAKPTPKKKPAKTVKPVAVKKSKPVAKKVEVKPVKKEVKKEIKAISKSNTKKVESHSVKPKTAKAIPVVNAKLLAKKVVAEPAKPVKVPKITAKTSVPYKPGYTPLEKRLNPVRASEPIVRYTDAELHEFKELITKKLESSKKELVYLQGLITRKDEMGGDESENRYMTMEDGGMSMEREQLSQMAARQIAYMDHLEKALIRIENKTYGICRVTGKLIDKARLRAVPHATLSLEAKLGLVKPAEE
jgi:RNA polymerase-binding transcription factor DksA